MPVWLAIAVVGMAGAASAQVPQNPSPMVESTRAHERIRPVDHPGFRLDVDAGLGRAVHLFIPSTKTWDAQSGQSSLLIHFHGAPFIVEDAVARLGSHHAAAVVNLGSGSSAYGHPLQHPGAFEHLLDSLSAAASNLLGRSIRFDHIDLSAFSAGYGGVRAILTDHPDRIHGVLLLDGLHTSYFPENVPMAQGGRLDSTLLDPFLDLAAAAIRGERAFLFTHSEVFPGTFASTTESADFLLDALDLPREAVLEWGPVGMQLLSRAGAGQFRLLGFAGNSAPDHVDHLHGMSTFLCLLHSAESSGTECRFSVP